MVISELNLSSPLERRRRCSPEATNGNPFYQNSSHSLTRLSVVLASKDCTRSKLKAASAPMHARASRYHNTDRIEGRLVFPAMGYKCGSGSRDHFFPTQCLSASLRNKTGEGERVIQYDNQLYSS